MQNRRRFYTFPMVAAALFATAVAGCQSVLDRERLESRSARKAERVVETSTQSGMAQDDRFTFPQGVYSGEEVEFSSLPNGAVVNLAMSDRLSLTQPVEPYTVEVADGIWRWWATTGATRQ